jgi:hypothetical protein
MRQVKVQSWSNVWRISVVDRAPCIEVEGRRGHMAISRLSPEQAEKLGRALLQAAAESKGGES